MVSFEIATDRQGRRRAEHVVFVGASATPIRPWGVGRGIWRLLLLFFTLILASVAFGKLPLAVVGLYGVVSLLAFVLYVWDKLAAKEGRWRIQEHTLHLIALLGGWPGALIAQKVLRHKSSKPSFLAVFRVTVLINCGALLWSTTPSGTAFVGQLLGRYALAL